MKEIVNNKEGNPLKYYQRLYEKLDPENAAARCLLPYSNLAAEFGLDFLGNSYGIAFPDFEMRLNRSSVPVDAGKYDTVKLLIIRFILYGAGAMPTGSYLTYREVPWGETYSANFDSRCVKRLALDFGACIERFKRAYMLLGGAPISYGDEACELCFIGSLSLRLILWSGDEEFPPSAQILFSDNFPAAFSAEDMAVIGELCIDALNDAAAFTDLTE